MKSKSNTGSAATKAAELPASRTPSPAVGWGVAACLALATVLLFARATGNGFVNYDDPDYVTANEHVKAGGLLVCSTCASFSNRTRA